MSPWPSRRAMPGVEALVPVLRKAETVLRKAETASPRAVRSWRSWRTVPKEAGFWGSGTLRATAAGSCGHGRSVVLGFMKNRDPKMPRES